MKKLATVFLVTMSHCIFFGSAPAQTPEGLEQEVAAVENAFAKTMTERDFDTFKTFLAPDTIFWGGDGPLRGKDAVMAAWAGFYQGKTAPFSWRSETVMVNEGGKIAFSTGPVSNPEGEVFAYFNSVWRRNDDGAWQIIFDKGTNLRAE